MRSLTLRVSRWLSLPGFVLLWARAIAALLHLGLAVAALALVVFVFLAGGSL